MNANPAGLHYQWQWPGTGPTAVSYGLDTEIFDSEKFPHVQTFVREAIQNSLDARDEDNKPVRVRFGFFEGPVAPRSSFLSDLVGHKKKSGLSFPADWNDGSMRWLVVEDSNTSGLDGDLNDRMSDFWNYWLNFGISNKTGAGRGGRGIGRVTFLIASGISTVIGITRRASDGVIAVCGMSVLRPGMADGEFKTSYAYLAKGAKGSIYSIYDDVTFQNGLAAAFSATDYESTGTSGLSLIIPYPHPSLTADGIVAAAIEHFAPAIISGNLVVDADGSTLDHTTIDGEADRVKKEFPLGPLREDPRRVLELVRHTKDAPAAVITVKDPKAKLDQVLDDSAREELRTKFQDSNRLGVAIDIPVIRNNQTTFSRLRAVLAHTPKGNKPVDLFFRDGMCLPEVSARNPADVDLVVQSDEGQLVAYLNFCEGKAHLNLIENKEVRENLLKNGFEGNYSVKRFVRSLMDGLRTLVMPDASKPDASIFSDFFSIPKNDPKKRQDDTGGPKPNPKAPPPPPPPPPPPKQPNIFLVDDLPDGFRVRANPAQTIWPANLRIEVAYADGSRSPKWSEHDFELGKLPTNQQGAAGKAGIAKNVMTIRDCGSDFQLEIRGFDARRELVTNVKGFRSSGKDGADA